MEENSALNTQMAVIGRFYFEPRENNVILGPTTLSVSHTELTPTTANSDKDVKLPAYEKFIKLQYMVRLWPGHLVNI